MHKTPSQIGALPVIFIDPTSGQPGTPVILYDAAGNALEIPSQAAFNAKADALMSFSDQTDDYTLVLGDAGKRVTITSDDPKGVSVPDDADVPFPIGTEIELFAGGTGQVSITAANAADVRGKGGHLSEQWSAAVLTKIGTDTWTLIGDLSS